MLNIQSAKLFWIISSRLESVRRTKPKPVGCVNVNVPVFGCWLLWFNLMPHWQQTFRTGKNALNLQTRWRTGALSTNRFPPLSLVITRGGDGNWEKWKIFQKRFPRGKICYVNFTLTNGANLVVVNGCLYTQLTRLLRRGKPKINIYGGDIFICSTYHLPTIRKISQQRNPRFSFDFLFVSFLQSVFVGNNISWWMKHWTCYIWAGLSSKWVVSAGDQQREWESVHPSIDGCKKKNRKMFQPVCHWIIIEHLAQGRMLIIRLPAQLTGMSISCHIFLYLNTRRTEEVPLRWTISLSGRFSSAPAAAAHKGGGVLSKLAPTTLALKPTWYLER